MKNINNPNKIGFLKKILIKLSRIKIKVISYYNFLELFCKMFLLDKNS